jgi:hypothetical protein
VEPRDDWLGRVGNLKVWARRGSVLRTSALLLLFSLARLQLTGTTKVSYAEAEPTAADL